MTSLIVFWLETSSVGVKTRIPIVVPVRFFYWSSQSIHFGDVSETIEPCDPKTIDIGEVSRPSNEARDNFLQPFSDTAVL